MFAESAVVVDHVYKKFCKSPKKSMFYGIADIGKNMMGLSSNSESLRPGEFFAVDDVSFSLEKGEAMGIIGQNGSGKSTVLKMISGIYPPDRGKILVNGRVGALIEMIAGVHPSLTGRENIYISGAMLGMTRKDTREKFEDIVGFADVGDFIDVPVKYYSTGMYVKLGFAVAIHCEPDVLILDEVLSAGDTQFIDRCLKRISERIAEGATLIIVSHNLKLISAICTRSIILHRGEQVIDSDVDTAINRYTELLVGENKGLTKLC